MALEAKRMIPRGNESITIHHEPVERPLERIADVSSMERKENLSLWNEERRREKERASVRDRIGLIWIRTIVVLDARTHIFRRCRWRMRLMIRKFKNRDPVGRPTPTSPCLLLPLFLSSTLFISHDPSRRARVWPDSQHRRYSIDRSRFVSAKLISNAPRCSRWCRGQISGCT